MLKKIKDSEYARWIVLLCLAIPMFCSYFFDDFFTTISHVFKTPDMISLAWNSTEYGLYRSAYSLLCVFGGLVICGMLLDKWGVKITGSIFVGFMVGGAFLVVYAISESFAASELCVKLKSFSNWLYGFDNKVVSGLGSFFEKPSLALAYVGCALFGLGSEIAGVAVTRSIAKWFKGKELALAMGLQLALARLGTLIAIVIMPVLINTESYVGYSELSVGTRVAMMLMVLAVIVWSVFVIMDVRYDRQEKHDNESANDGVKTDEDKFRFSDIFKILGNKYYILLSLLCVFFYCCIISFRKFATSIVIPRFDVDAEIAALMVSMIPFCTLVFTPLFGVLVDKVGKATKLMLLGSIMVLSAHLILAFAPGYPIFGYLGIGILGIGYSLVPAAMWPSVPKIVPEKNLGTAFSLIYWIQNMGMMITPMIVGYIITTTMSSFSKADSISGELVAAFYSEYFFVFLGCVAVLVSIIFSRLSDKNPEMELDLPNKRK